MRILKYIFPILIFISIFISAISRESLFTSVAISIATILVGLIITYKENRGVKIPKNFVGIILFVLLLYTYLFFVKEKTNPLAYATVFSSALIFWLIFYNLKLGGEILYSLILNLALTYSFLYIITKIFNLDSVPFSKLFFMEGLVSRHYHVGDLWAFALVLILGKKWGNFNLKTWLLIDIGFLFLVLSNARSSYLSLIVGFIYVLARKTSEGSFKKLIPTVFISLMGLLFIFSSIHKTTLFSRPYFMQSIESFSRHPLGVGMGNFKQIGMEYYTKTGDATVFSLYTHNIFLEAFSGVGVFSVLFLVFLYSTVKDILTEKKKNMEWGAVVLAILANFMFDTTYTIPGLIWIMFMVLGVFQSRADNS